MLHAAATLCVLIVIWMLSGSAWSSPQSWAIAAGAGVLCVAAASRFGGVGSSFFRAPLLLWVSIARSGAVLRGAASMIRRAVSADVTLNPALVRVKTRPRQTDRAAFAHLLTATPGMAVVETDTEGMLVHVMNEDRIDASDLGRLEQTLSSGGGA